MSILFNSTVVPTMAIVGRPNVGKSSLFNVIAGRRLAIVHEESGVTRDRIAAPVTRNGRHFQIIDTGGLGVFSDSDKGVDIWDSEIRTQVEAAVDDADIILFTVNIREGIVALDREIASRLMESGKEVLLVVNKCDNSKLQDEAVEFMSLGFNEFFPVSSTHRLGINSLLERILKDISPLSGNEAVEAALPVAVVGRPNVGKSSMINCFLGEKRVMVSETAGTTRDSIDIPFEIEYKGEKLPAFLIDTAGMRKRSKVTGAIEKFSIMRAESAIKRARIVIFTVEASTSGLTAQDRRIARIIADNGKACIIAANKWDTCEVSKRKDILNEIRRTLPRMTYAPVVFTCALSGYNFNLILDNMADIMGQMELHIPTSVLNGVIRDAVELNAPPVTGRKPLKIYYATMIGNAPPRFVLFVNDPELAAANYMGYLNNYLRKCFGFKGLPLDIKLRAKPKKDFVPGNHKKKKRHIKPGNRRK